MTRSPTARSSRRSRTSATFTPAKFEYQDRQGFYIHSKVAGEAAAAKGGNWRQPHTSVLLSPKYSPSDEITWGFKFRWAAMSRASGTRWPRRASLT